VSQKDNSFIQPLYAHTDSVIGTVNEDAWGQTKNAMWVIDGATGCGPQYSTEKSDAQLFTQILNETLKAHLLHGAETTTQKILETVILETRESFLKAIGRQSIPHPHQPSAAFAMVRIINRELEATILGDCKIRIEQNGVSVNARCDHRIEPFEERTLRKVKHLKQQHPSITNNELRQILKPFILENRAFMNRENGYWVISFEPIAAGQAIVYSLQIHGKDTLVSLSSDGFDRLSDLYGEKLSPLSVLQNKPENIRGLFQKLRKIEENDPVCTAYPRVKTYDDATFMLAEIS